MKGSTSPGTTFDTALRPAAATRALSLVPLAVLVVLAVVRLPDNHWWGAVLAHGVAVGLALWFSLRLLTTRVWIDIDGLHVRSFGRESVGPLRSPYRLEIREHLTHGPRQSWRVTVRTPDGRRQATISPPWLSDWAPLERLIREATSE